MTLPAPESRPVLAWAFRAALFFAFWLVIGGTGVGDLIVGVVAALLAATASLTLLPPGQGRGRPVALALLVLRFPPQALRAGIDVAWRAFAPGPPVRPTVFAYPSRLPAGLGRDAFLTYASLLPGTVPAGLAPDASGVLVHALDDGPAAAQGMVREEALFARGIGRDV